MANWRFYLIIERSQWRISDFVSSWTGVDIEFAVLCHHRQVTIVISRFCFIIDW